MRRRPPAPETADDALPPLSLRTFALAEWIDWTAKPPVDVREGTWRYWHARRRWRDAGEAWCEARGVSYCMTFLRWRRPSPSEQAAGHTRGVTLPRPVDGGRAVGIHDPRHLLKGG